MKPASFILPGLVIVSGIAWLSTQALSLSKLKAENSQLLDQIHRASRTTNTSPTGTGSSAKRAGSNVTAQSKKAGMDWKNIIAEIREMERSGGIGNMRGMLRLQQQIQSMTVDEIVASIDEIAALGLNDQDRIMLEQMLAGPLALKSPETALNKFVDRIQEQNGSWSWQLSNALKGWAQKDLPSATAWFDQQIASGIFDSKSLDGRSDARTNFEGAFIAALISKDPAAAAVRLSALPENQRSGVLKNHEFTNLSTEEQPAFAALVRGQLPEKDQAATIANPAIRLAAQEGYDKVSGYIETISATDQERATIVAKTAESRIGRLSNDRKIGSAEIDEMRAWAESQSPGSADNATGLALGRITNKKNSFAETAQLALHYNQSGGNDQVIATFLDNSWNARTNQENKELARSLAQQISDETRRAYILEKLK